MVAVHIYCSEHGSWVRDSVIGQPQYVYYCRLILKVSQELVLQSLSRFSFGEAIYYVALQYCITLLSTETIGQCQLW